MHSVLVQTAVCAHTCAAAGAPSAFQIRDAPFSASQHCHHIWNPDWREFTPFHLREKMNEPARLTWDCSKGQMIHQGLSLSLHLRSARRTWSPGSLSPAWSPASGSSTREHPLLPVLGEKRLQSAVEQEEAAPRGVTQITSRKRRFAEITVFCRNASKIFTRRNLLISFHNSKTL